ncbi:MAG TPA: DUF6603 domain-containing protein [Pyrinomonadaceae bacterium]|jgi:hypothetical protein
MSISLDDLKAAVRAGVSGDNFALPTARLAAPAIAAVSAALFPGDTIRLTGTRPPVESPDGGAITVSGIGVDLPFAGMTLEIKFFRADGNAALTLTATGDANWKLSDSFPVLGRSVLAAFSFSPPTPPRLRLDSRGHVGGPAVLTFDGLLDLSAASGGLARLVGRSEQPLSGTLRVQQNGGQLSAIALTARDSAQVNLIIITVERLTFTVGSDLTYNALDDDFSAVPYVQLGADFPFSAQGRHYDLPISVSIADFGRAFRFSADPTSTFDAGLQELAQLTNGVGLGSFIPSDFRLEDVVTLDDFFFDFDASGGNPQVTLIGVGVRSDAPWKVLHLDASNKDLQAENVRLAFRLRDPFGAKQPWLGLSGDVRLGDAGVLEISTFYPGFSVEGALKAGTVLRFDELMRDFVGADASIPAIKIYALSFRLAAGQFSILVDLEGFWNIGDSPVAVEDVRLEIDNSGGKTRVAAAGKFGIAGVEVFVSASYLGADGGWIFEGHTGLDEPIHIGVLMADLAKRFGHVTLPGAVSDLVVENLKVKFDTRQKEFTFGCEGKFRADDTDVDIKVDLVVRAVGGGYTKDFSGILRVGELDFTLHFVQNATSDFFVATYRPAVAGHSQDVKRLVQSVSAAVANYVPEGLTIKLKDVLFAYGKRAAAGLPGDGETRPGGGPAAQGGATAKFIFGLDVGTGINLSNLPLIGQEFPPDATVGVDDLQILFVSEGLTARDVADFNGLIPDGVTRISAQPPEQQDASGAGGPAASAAPAVAPVVLAKGFSVSAQMNFGGARQCLSLQGGASNGPAGSAATAAAGAGVSATDLAGDSAGGAAAPDHTKWFVVQKSFGPVYFDKVGVQLREKNLWFLLKAALSAGGLTLSLDGLAVGGSLDHYLPPAFDLRGIGVAYRSGPVEVAGAFLREQAAQQDGTTYDKYDGAAVIETAQFAVAAVGSYAKLHGHPSMFVYAVLDYPLGGPAFFFVTGLAAGFGFNRALAAPPVEQVAQFPLVAEAVNGARRPDDLPAALDKLSGYVPPAVGESFLAVGVKFTSFKLLDSFALLTVDFGRSFEINLLGLSTLVVPTPAPGEPPATPLAEVQMAFRASYVPADGFLGVSAQLTTDSFILSRACRLTGGFAFWSWFAGEHAGDFVYTLGGYHPSFNAPAHYPKVPRLAFNWRVDGNTSIKGDAYYALTASALMAGGHLEATWEGDDLSAWFKLGADFLISWKPYHYDASVYVDIGVEYTFHLFGTHHITADVGADLHLWGPEFSGMAHIHLWIVSFDVSFGADSSRTPRPVDWPTFRASFLPPDQQVCSLALKSGLSGQDAGGGWLVNPKEFTLVTNSVIPSTEAFAGGAALAGAGGGAKLGVAPMAVGSYVARQTVTITKGGTGVENQFDFIPVRKKAPAALWGTTFAPALNGAAFIEDALAGFEIRPKVQPQAGQTAAISAGTLQYSTDTLADAFGWESFAEFAPDAKGDADRALVIRHSLAAAAVAAARSRLLGEFGMQTTVTASGASADAFLATPQTGPLAL